MARIRSKDTRPEFAIRSLLHQMGFRFRLHRKDLPGSPDIVLPKYRAIILVNGCFWHFHKNCRDGKIPASNKNYWNKKLQQNINRDKMNLKKLRYIEWRVLIIWECEVRKKFDRVAKKITDFLLAELR